MWKRELVLGLILVVLLLGVMGVYLYQPVKIKLLVTPTPVDVSESRKRELSAVRRERYREYVIDENGFERVVSLTGDLGSVRLDESSALKKMVIIVKSSGEEMEFRMPINDATIIDNREGRLAGMTVERFVETVQQGGFIISCNIERKVPMAQKGDMKSYTCGSLILRDKYLI